MLTPSIQSRFAQACKAASANIHRHRPLSTAQELQGIRNAVLPKDDRDAYGKGGCVADFEQQLCTLFDKPAAVFLPTGTLAQCAAMKCYAIQSERDGVALHPTSHLLLHEHMAIEQLWGLKAISVGHTHRAMTLDDLMQVDSSTLAALIIELPMREIGGVLPSWQELELIRKWCDEYGVALHLDGARVWQTSTYYQRSLAEILSLFDSAYVSFYKDMGGIFGAALLGSEALVDEVRIWARRAGGNPITMYPEVLAARIGLQRYLPQMPVFVDYAARLSQALAGIDLLINPQTPPCSMFHIQLPIAPQRLAERIVAYAEATGIIVLPLPRIGDDNSSICEISVGDSAIQHPVSYWAEHVSLCLGQSSQAK
ncbi:threonine aldolase family protein [Aestuariibacter salexigens]|uniref:threonine aldolase family protein n=1 Tax=Aestuariibacter salexigens TaxID=226010 RepID=UPI0003FD418C|nr:beta-eliminating lyase-related protein [Aestuariibacter salexigens]